MSVCLSLAAFPHYCTDPDVTWENGMECPLVVQHWADLQSVHGFHCYDFIALNAKCQCQRVLLLALSLVVFSVCWLCGCSSVVLLCNDATLLSVSHFQMFCVIADAGLSASDIKCIGLTTQRNTFILWDRSAVSYFLWSPYGIEQTIIFLPCDFYLLSSFFPRLISAAVDWMSAILPHMWP